MVSILVTRTQKGLKVKDSIPMLFFTVIAMMTVNGEISAQEINNNVCAHQYSDADGDGHGWENNASCVITNESAPAPTFINEETGQVVELIRPYWDGNKDIANRTIQCDLYHFDDDSRAYTLAPDGWPPTSFEFNHLPIPSTSPYLGWLESWRTNGAPFWTISDGLYRGENSGTGQTMLKEEYIESVTESSGNKAIRIWVNAGYRTSLDHHQESWVLEDGFYQCRDISGEDFSPTGAPGQPSAIEHSLADLTISVSDAENPITIPIAEESSNLETGQPVILQKLYWDYNTDLAGKSLACIFFSWRSGAYRQGIQQPTFYTFDYLVQGNNSIHYHSSFEGQQGQEALPVENGIIEPNRAVFVSPMGEVTDSAIRFWFSSEAYTECEAKPSGTAPINAAPINAAPIDAAPINAAPIDAAPIGAAPINAVPIGTVANDTVTNESPQVDNIENSDSNVTGEEQALSGNPLATSGPAEQGGGVSGICGILMLYLIGFLREKKYYEFSL